MIQKYVYANEYGLYDPVSYPRQHPEIEKPLSKEDIKRRIHDQEILLNEFFSDVKPGTIVLGPTEQYGLTLENVKSFNLGDELDKIYNELHHYIMQYGFTPDIKERGRNRILHHIAHILSTNPEIRNRFKSTISPLIIASNRDRQNRELSEILKLYDNFTRRNGKIGIGDYEIKFSCRVQYKSSDPDKMITFIDSEGLCFPIHPIGDIDKSTMEEGIYILKRTAGNSEQFFEKLPLPEENLPTKSTVLNGVFFHTFKEFKETYKCEYNSNFESSTLSEDERLLNVRKLVGRQLFNGVTETSHGLISSIVGYSLSRKSFFTCSPKFGVSEIPNITPSTLGVVEFKNALNEVGLTRELLSTHDYIIRRTNIGSGSGMVSAQNTKVEKIKLSRENNLSKLSEGILDNDLALFNETGVAVFSSREAAENCMKYGGGDVEKYVQYLTNKTSNKSEKRIFIDSVKNAALVGAGAAIPKLIEYLIHRNKTKEDNMGIIKPMLPPLSVGETLMGDKLAFDVFLKPLNIARKVMSTGIVIKVGLITAGAVIMAKKLDSIIETFGNFFEDVFNGKIVEGVKNGAIGFGKVALDIIKTVGTSAWEFLKIVAKSVKGGFNILFNTDMSIGDRITSLFSLIKGGSISMFNWVLAQLKETYNILKPFAIKAFDLLKNIGRKIFDWVGGIYQTVFA